mgnify:CR=1 FL=1
MANSDPFGITKKPPSPFGDPPVVVGPTYRGINMNYPTQALPDSPFGPPPPVFQPQQFPSFQGPSAADIKAPSVHLPTPSEQTSGVPLGLQELLTSQNTAPTQPYQTGASLPGIQDFSQQIGELGKQRMESGLAALQKTFAPQTELLRETQEARGLTGSGVETEALRRLAGEQAFATGQFAASTNQQTLEAQIQEMQRVSGMTENRAMTLLGINSNVDLENVRNQLQARGMNLQTAGQFFTEAGATARAQGQLDQAANFENVGNALKLADSINAYNIEGVKYGLEIFKNDMETYKAEMLRLGVWNDIEDRKLADYQTSVDACSLHVTGEGASQGAFDACVAKARHRIYGEALPEPEAPPPAPAVPAQQQTPLQQPAGIQTPPAILNPAGVPQLGPLTIPTQSLGLAAGPSPGYSGGDGGFGGPRIDIPVNYSEEDLRWLRERGLI